MSPLERANEVGDRPEVRRWLKRLRAVLRDCPPDVQIRAGTDSASVFALAPGGQEYTRFFDQSRDWELDDEDANIERLDGSVIVMGDAK